MQSASTPWAETAGVKKVSTNLKGFGVPFKINADDGMFVEVQLYLSTDAGRSWTFYGRETTDKEEFPFVAEQDGEYWFALKTLNRDRRLMPSGDPQPELKIVVDTLNPVLDFRVQTDPAGRVQCRWKATDANLKPSSLKMLYQPVMADGNVQPWKTVPVKLSGVARNGVYADQIGWWPDTNESRVNVAMEIQDDAGNIARVDRSVVLPKTSWRNRNGATALPQVAGNQLSGNQATNKQTALKPAPYGQTLQALPKQPDWAYPGWQPAMKQRPLESAPADPVQKIPSNAGDKTAKAQPHGNKPGDVVCENGVCRLAGKESQTKQKTVALPPVIARRTPSGKVLNQPVPRTASRSTQQVPLLDRRQVPELGPGEEYVDPPVPPGYVAKKPVASVAAQNAGAAKPNPRSINWNSEQESWQPKNNRQQYDNRQQLSNRRIDPSIAPLPTRSSPMPEPATQVPSNPASMTYRGNQVIGESSTMGATNQYRGQQTMTQVPPPELLPRHQMPEKQLPKQGLQSNFAGATIRRQPSLDDSKPNPNLDAGNASNFSAAGFARPPKFENRPAAGSGRLPISDRPNRRTKAPVQIIGSKRFRLNYGIDSIDPSGVGKVNLWMTRDDGKTWNAWGSDPDNRSPFPVEVMEEGRYGFRVVIKSKDGLTGQGPASGDDADMWILVDTQAPLTKITSVPYGRGEEAGRLVINFKVADALITLRPITLSYAANPAGPWQVIKDGVRNEGRYVWKVGREVPERIFLKIEAVDRAGNVGTHVLNQPVDVSGLVPRGTIHGVTPVGR